MPPTSAHEGYNLPRLYAYGLILNFVLSANHADHLEHRSGHFICQYPTYQRASRNPLLGHLRQRSEMRCMCLGARVELSSPDGCVQRSCTFYSTIKGRVALRLWDVSYTRPIIVWDEHRCIGLQKYPCSAFSFWPCDP